MIEEPLTAAWRRRLAFAFLFPPELTHGLHHPRRRRHRDRRLDRRHVPRRQRGDIGGAVGSLAGAAIDSWLVASMAPTQRIAGQRLDTLQITASTEGAVIPRVYGRMRIGGNIIWATDFREETETTRHGGGGKGGGGGGGTEVTEYFYFASLAVALCEGPITGIGRIWADGKPMSLDGVTMRVHLGGEDQEPDPFIAAKMGAANTPAYRGTAYVVFEELPLERFGNRLPQLSFEVFRPILDGESAESLVRAVTLIPASGEFAYATEVVRREVGETTIGGERQCRGPCRRHRGRARPAAGLRAEGRDRSRSWSPGSATTCAPGTAASVRASRSARSRRRRRTGR